MAKGMFPAQGRQSVAYEVRIYSISGGSFGEVVWAKRIRAAHCLTSLQFSPTSEHILLAYGRQGLPSLWAQRGKVYVQAARIASAPNACWRQHDAQRSFPQYLCQGVMGGKRVLTCARMCRRHVSLLRSLVADVESSVVPYHTIVEVYRVAPGMPLMRVLPSAADEVNAALFHPFKASLCTCIDVPVLAMSIL